MKVNKCGDCIHYESFCSPYALPDEEFAEVGGCRVFKNKADFVEVVRCKDCKHCDKAEYFFCDFKDATKNVCRLFGRQMQEDDFCSYGERKGGAE